MPFDFNHYTMLTFEEHNGDEPWHEHGVYCDEAVAQQRQSHCQASQPCPPPFVWIGEILAVEEHPHHEIDSHHHESIAIDVSFHYAPHIYYIIGGDEDDGGYFGKATSAGEVAGNAEEEHCPNDAQQSRYRTLCADIVGMNALHHGSHP